MTFIIGNHIHDIGPAPDQWTPITGELDPQAERHIGNVCRPGASYYVSRVHHFGAKKYIVVGRHDTEADATIAMAIAFAGDKTLNRADVLRAEYEMSYYEPSQVCELRR